MQQIRGSPAQDPAGYDFQQPKLARFHHQLFAHQPVQLEYNCNTFIVTEVVSFRISEMGPTKVPKPVTFCYYALLLMMHMIVGMATYHVFSPWENKKGVGKIQRMPLCSPRNPHNISRSTITMITIGVMSVLVAKSLPQGSRNHHDQTARHGD